jgi:predicted branched-subunit amino acid permease
MTTPTPLWRHPEFAVGARETRDVALGIGAWGLVAGIAMSKAGLGAAFAVAMSLFVFAGSAQLAALPLMVQGAPLWVIWATALCVNLRFIIFSAGWRPYFQTLSRPKRLFVTYFTVDFTYIAFMRRFPRPGDLRAQLAYVAGNATVSWIAWQAMTVLGVVLADVIPERWGLGFAGSLALLGITASLLVDGTTRVAAAVAACAAFAAFALPFHLNIVVAIAAAMAVGVLIDHAVPARTADSPPKDVA